MKRTEEKVVPARWDKTGIKANPNAGKPRQPARDNQGVPPATADVGHRKKRRPEEWQPGTPTDHESHRRSDNDDLDDIEEKETTL